MSATFDAIATPAATDMGGDRREPRADVFAIFERPDAQLFVVCDPIGDSPPIWAIVIARLRATFEAGGDANAIHESIRAVNRDAPRGTGAGSTIDALLLSGGEASIAHAGDGRVYRVRGSEVTALTVDHTLQNEYRAKHPELSAEQIAALPTDIFVRAIGMDDEIDLDRTVVPVERGDVFVVCSNGLYASIGEDAMRRILTRSTNATSIVRDLIASARDARDHAIAVVCVEDS